MNPSKLTRQRATVRNPARDLVRSVASIAIQAPPKREACPTRVGQANSTRKRSGNLRLEEELQPQLKSSGVEGSTRLAELPAVQAVVCTTSSGCKQEVRPVENIER